MFEDTSSSKVIEFLLEESSEDIEGKLEDSLVELNSERNSFTRSTVSIVVFWRASSSLIRLSSSIEVRSLLTSFTWSEVIESSWLVLVSDENRPCSTISSGNIIVAIVQIIQELNSTENNLYEKLYRLFRDKRFTIRFFKILIGFIILNFSLLIKSFFLICRAITLNIAM